MNFHQLKRQTEFRELEKLSHTDLLWLIMKNKYGSGWTIGIDTNQGEEE